MTLEPAAARRVAAGRDNYGGNIMRKSAILLALAATITATTAFTSSAFAQDDPKPGRPLMDREPTAIDVAATPMSDLNIRKDAIPPQLIAAQTNPYDLTGLNRCPRIAAAVGELDALLGEDIDVAPAEKRGPSAGKLAQWVVGTFIPFRGAIRELSGANEQRRRVQLAIQAGMTRRAFLKGVGQARGCRYPARAATAEVLALRTAEREAALAASETKESAKNVKAGPRGSARAVLAPTAVSVAK